METAPFSLCCFEYFNTSGRLKVFYPLRPCNEIGNNLAMFKLHRLCNIKNVDLDGNDAHKKIQRMTTNDKCRISSI